VRKYNGWIWVGDWGNIMDGNWCVDSRISEEMDSRAHRGNGLKDTSRKWIPSRKWIASRK